MVKQARLVTAFNPAGSAFKPTVPLSQFGRTSEASPRPPPTAAPGNPVLVRELLALALAVQTRQVLSRGCLDQLAARGIKTEAPLRDDGKIFHTIVLRQAEIGDFAGAISTAKRVSDDVDRIRAIVEAANARLENSDGTALASVGKALKDAFAEAKNIDGRQSEVGQILVEIGRAQATAKDVAGTRETFNFARTKLLAADFKERDEILAALAAAQVLSGDRIQAMNIVREMQDEALRSMALASVAGALAESSNLDSARPLFRLAFEDAVKTVNEKSRNAILQHILLQQTRSGLFNDAFTTAGSGSPIPRALSDGQRVARP